MTATYTPEEIAAVLDEGRALEAENTAVMAEVQAVLAPYEHPGIVIYPEHCDALLAATHSENFTYQVGEPRNRYSSTSTPVAKWRACNAKNRRAIARVRKEIAALLAHPDYGYYRDANGERYTLAEAQAEHAAAMAKHVPAPTPAPAQPAYTLTEQLEALRKEAHAAARQGLTEIVALLKERACALAESYLDTGHMCDKGHWLNEYGQCETCLEAAQQLACARAHVDQTLRRWEFEAETSDVPF